MLRAVAALGVALSHYGLFYSSPQRYPALAKGAAGVDLFFVISGFIMVYSSRSLFGQPSAPLTFMLRRVVRVVPLYWLVTTGYLAVTWASSSVELTPSPVTIITSYVFFPHARADSSIQPLVGQGWTLNYEMMFYAIFGATLFARRFASFIAAGWVLAALVVIGIVWEPTSAPLRFWTSPLILEFAFGMLIGLAYLEGQRVPRWLGWVATLGGLAWFLDTSIVIPNTPGILIWDTVMWRVCVWGLPGLSIVAGAALGHLALPRPLMAPLVAVGEASYALYLMHPLVIRAFVSGIRRVGVDLPFWPGLAISMFLCVVVAIAVQRLIERPLTQFLRGLGERQVASRA